MNSPPLNDFDVIMARIAVNMKKKRQALQLNRLQLAERMGASSDSTIAWIETRKGNPSLRVLCRIATALDTTLDDLIQGPN